MLGQKYPHQPWKKSKIINDKIKIVMKLYKSVFLFISWNLNSNWNPRFPKISSNEAMARK
jgi:hypothetical protein